jgi:hypothetical protein
MIWQPFFSTGLLIAIPLIAVFFALIWRKRSRILIKESICANCDYPIRGLPTSICPECGSDLSRQGAVLHPGTTGPLSKAILALFIAAIIVPISLLTTPMLVRQLPAPRSFGENFTLIPGSAQYHNFFIVHENYGHVPVPAGIISVNVEANSHYGAWIYLDSQTMDCSFPGPNDRTRGPFTKQILLDSMKKVGIDTSSSAVDAEVSDVYQAIQQIAASKQPSFTANWTSSHSAKWGTIYRPDWYNFAGYASWVLLAIAIFIIVVRRNRVLSQPIIAAASASP